MDWVEEERRQWKTVTNPSIYYENLNYITSREPENKV